MVLCEEASVVVDEVCFGIAGEGVSRETSCASDVALCREVQGSSFELFAMSFCCSCSVDWLR